MDLSAKAERVCTGFEFVEGPVWVDEGSPLLAAAGAGAGGLVFSDIPASRLYCLTGDRTAVVREPTGQANGNALDPQGMLLSCEHENRRVSRFDGRGTARRVVDRYDGKRLNSPNDVAVRGDGMIFFTDPPYGVADQDRELDFQGVYRVDPDSPDPVLLCDDFEKPNGLAFSGDEATLYIADTEKGELRSFSVAADGALAEGRVFCECERPDGIAVDTAGNVWVACMENVEIFDSHGRRIGAVPLPERPANIAFGGDDRSTLYVCARSSIYSIATVSAGVICSGGRGRSEAMAS